MEGAGALRELAGLPHFHFFLLVVACLLAGTAILRHITFDAGNALEYVVLANTIQCAQWTLSECLSNDSIRTFEY